MNGGRKLSAWNMFVKKVYQEGKRKNKNYSFKQALNDASKRKGEMGKSKKGGSNPPPPPPEAMGTLTPAIYKGGRTRRRSMGNGKSRRRRH